MKRKDKKDNNIGLIILLIILMGAVGFVLYYNETIKSKNNKPEKSLEEKVEDDENEINSYYSLLKLNYEFETGIPNTDFVAMESDFSISNVSDEFKIIYGLKDQPAANIGTENISKPVVDNDGYIYNGKYIRASAVQGKIKSLFGSNIAYNNKTVTCVDKKYVYDSKALVYRIYEKKYSKQIDKVSYITSDWDKNNIYITEYVAYTKILSVPQTSFTRHNKLLPININDNNIKENLDIIDKYKYTFTYNEALKTYN